MSEAQQLSKARETIELLSHQLVDTELRARKAEAKLAAIGKLSPTDYDDREQLLGGLFRILRGHSYIEEAPE